MMEFTRCLCCGKALTATECYYHVSCMKKLFSSAHIPALNFSQTELNELAKNIILERISVPGVQPKLSLHLEKGDKTSCSRLTLVGLEGEYILKPQTPKWAHLPEAEHFCMLLARKCKIATAEFGLIPLKSGELAYITRRMDRTPAGPLHMEDFCQILNKMTAQKYIGSMEQIGKALRSYSDVSGLDTIRFFELAIFCFLAGNSDMHLKNFSMLRYADGHYEFAPAYDLVPVKIIMPADKEELALSLNGKKNRLNRTDLVSFGNSLQLTGTQIQKAVVRIASATEIMLPDALSSSFLPESMQKQIASLVSNRLNRLC